MDAEVGGAARESPGDVVDVATAGFVVDHAPNGEIVAHWQVEDRLERVARVAVRGGRVAGRYVRFDAIELGLVRDVANDAGLRTGAEQRALRAFEHLDTLEVGGIDVEVTPGQLSGLVVEIDRDIGEAADHPGSLQGADGRRQAAHVDVVLAGAEALRRDVRQVLDVVIEGGHVQLGQGVARECLNRDRHVLQVLLAAVRRDDHFLQFDRRTRRGRRVRRRGEDDRRCRRTEDHRNGRRDLRIRLHRVAPRGLVVISPLERSTPAQAAPRQRSIPLTRVALE